jgi:hypothetical protein
MNKTVYLRDEEVPVWEKARELAGDKLSPIIVAALKSFISEKEATSKGFERIVVAFNDSEDYELPKKKAFYGRWIFTPGHPTEASDDDDVKYFCAVAETAKGGVVLLERRESENLDSPFKFRVFSSFRDAAADPAFRYAVQEAVERRGVPVEELDI